MVEFNYEPWRPSIFMPRWASRIALEITNIRVERLQEIKPKECQKEGIKLNIYTNNPYQYLTNEFRKLWDSINAKTYPWSSNPWVWVIEFKQVTK